jgi:predicted GNAT family N-acyltransferase
MDNIDIVGKIKLLSVSNLIERVSLDENETKIFLENIYTTNNSEKLIQTFETIKDVTNSIEEFPQVNFDSFDCGDEEINFIIQKELYSQSKLNYVKAFCITEKTQLIGVCSLSLSSLDMYLQEDMKTSFPCVKLNFVAVDKMYQGQNYAKCLLIHALHKIRFISHSVGCLGVYLETAFNAHHLYEEVGFTQLIDKAYEHELRKVPMWLNIETIKKVFD